MSLDVDANELRFMGFERPEQALIGHIPEAQHAVGTARDHQAARRECCVNDER